MVSGDDRGNLLLLALSQGLRFFLVTMPLNIPGILVPFQLLVYPRLVIPHVFVKGAFISGEVSGVSQPRRSGRHPPP